MTHLHIRMFTLRFEALEDRTLLAGDGSDVVIQEIMASNQTTIRDQDGESSDWIEIVNRGASEVNLSGWSLTDREDRVGWILPPINLNPGQIQLIFASGKDRRFGSELHTGFKLDADGEYLALLAPDRITRLSEFRPFPVLSTDISYGIPQGETNVYAELAKPTPGGPNDRALIRRNVEFSRRNPLFVDSFELTLSGVGAHERIVYTLDRTTPNADSPTYVGPILIDRTMQVRARIVNDQGDLGSVETHGFSRLSTSVADMTSVLPIMVIDNFGAGAIPNKGFPDQTGANTFQVPRQSAMVTLLDASDHSLSRRIPSTVSRIGIRVRGAFSATFSEPGYSLDFWDERDQELPRSVLGMPSNAEWVLLAPNPLYDRTLIDSTLLMRMGSETSLWSPRFRYVEAFINTQGNDVTMQDYVGLYVFTEKVSRGSDRIDFPKLSDDATSGGWMVTVNRMDAIPENDRDAIPQHFHTAGPDGIQQTPPNSRGRGDDFPQQYNAFINFEDPNGYKILPVQRRSIESWFRTMEDVLFGRTDVVWNDPVNGYAKYIDIPTFVDYFLLNVMSFRGDQFLLSMWLYNPDPQGNGKLTMGPIWDSDLVTFEPDPRVGVSLTTEALWYGRMFQDPEFVQRVNDRWFDLRGQVLETSRVTDLVEQFHQEISPAAAGRDGVPNWTERLTSLKSWFDIRLPFIDRALLGPVPLADRQVVRHQSVKLVESGELYYTLDGTDPRGFSGATSNSAIRAEGGQISLSASATITVRTLRNGRWSAPSSARWTVFEREDLNRNGSVGGDDVDTLWVGMRGEPDDSFDLNRDLAVDERDVTYLVESVLGTRRGDVNVDRRVDFGDFLVLASRFGEAGGWNDGDTNGDRLVDFEDFLTLADSFGVG